MMKIWMKGAIAAAMLGLMATISIANTAVNQAVLTQKRSL